MWLVWRTPNGFEFRVVHCEIERGVRAIVAGREPMADRWSSKCGRTNRKARRDRNLKCIVSKLAPVDYCAACSNAFHGCAPSDAESPLSLRGLPVALAAAFSRHRPARLHALPTRRPPAALVSNLRPHVLQPAR
jgi:hypothetical protein